MDTSILLGGSSSNEIYSATYTGIYNLNSISSIKIHCFQASVSQGSWKKNVDLDLFEELPEISQSKFSNMLQRFINKPRVDEIRDKYLKDKNKPIKYFPPLTVVLLPKNQTTKSVEEKYIDDSSEGLGIKGFKVGIQNPGDKTWTVSNPQKSGVAFNFAWDKNLYYAIVIDGQHRLSALREANIDMYINVNFIVFGNIEQSKTLIMLTRELFIDINNTPKRVSEGRLILMDDKNILRLITRNLLAQAKPEATTLSDYLFQGKPFENIPDALLHFGDEDESAREKIQLGILNSGPMAITNLFILHLIVKDIIFDSSFTYLCEVLDQALCREIEDFVRAADINLTPEEFIENLEGEGFRKLTKDAIFKNYACYKFALRRIEETDDDQESHLKSKLELSLNDDDFWFRYSQEDSEKIARALRDKVVGVIPKIFFSMIWVSAIVKSVDKAIERLREHKLSADFSYVLLDYLKQCSRSREVVSPPVFVKRYVGFSDQDREKMIGVLEEMVSVVTKPDLFENNLLRTSVGQRAVFIPFSAAVDIESLCQNASYITHRPDIQSISRDGFVSAYSIFLQDLERVGFFQKNFCIPLLDLSPDFSEFYIWENVLVRIRDEDSRATMIPTPSAAQNASSLVLTLFGFRLEKRLVSNLKKSIGKAAEEYIDNETLFSLIRDKIVNPYKDLEIADVPWFYAGILSQKTKFTELCDLVTNEKSFKKITSSKYDLNESGSVQMIMEALGSLVLESIYLKLHKK